MKGDKKFIHLVLALGLLALGAAGMAAQTLSKPGLVRKPPVTPLPPVLVATVATGPVPVLVFGEGTVRPLREITLSAQVGGKVVFVSESLADGGRFSPDEVLVRIEREDYVLAVTSAQARVKDAQSKYMLAKAESEAAKQEWRDIRKGDGSPPALVARTPQLAAALAALEAAKADLQKAELNLTRTEIKAPFEGRVSQKNVDLGQVVSPNQGVAAIFSTEAAEIVVPLPDEDLYWLDVPGFSPGDGPGSPARVQARLAGRDMTWPGRVVRAQGKLDPGTRLIGLVVRVEQPYAASPPLAPGLFVSVEIEGRTLQTAALIPRAALRPDGLVWVVDGENRLVFRRVETARVQGDQAVVTAGLAEGERVAVSSLKAVTDGMAVRPVPQSTGTPAGDEPTAENRLEDPAGRDRS
ncbi:MAG: efflux RND transporter periplasmic adaptor subunit [Thermodesulfobacteriota bacterium]